jgi:uncharacterized protein (TIGR02466 family)
MTQRAVVPLFSTPIYINNVGALQAPDVQALEYTSRLPDGSSFPFLSSVDKRVLHRPSFKVVHDVVQREIEIYAREVLAVSRKIEFYVTNSWVNIYKRGASAGGHTHNNSLLSGVLYLKAPERCGDIVFHRDGNSLVPFPPALDLDMDSFNLYNCKSWGHSPKTNDLCLFPSTVMHSVDPNGADEERCCLAFNVFVRGEFGGLHELNLR